MPSTNDSSFSPNNVWGSAAPAGTEEELTLPSGQTCRAKKMSIESMIASGMLAEADALTAQVTKHTRKIKGAKGKPDGVELNENALMKDPKGLGAMIGLMDRALPHIVVSPAIRLHWTETTVGKTTVTKTIPVEDREEGFVYTDQVGFEDKVDLFNWAAGGLGSMLQFRE